MKMLPRERRAQTLATFKSRFWACAFKSWQLKRGLSCQYSSQLFFSRLKFYFVMCVIYPTCLKKSFQYFSVALLAVEREAVRLTSLLRVNKSNPNFSISILWIEPTPMPRYLRSHAGLQRVCCCKYVMNFYAEPDVRNVSRGGYSTQSMQILFTLVSRGDNVESDQWDIHILVTVDVER